MASIKKYLIDILRGLDKGIDDLNQTFRRVTGWGRNDPLTIFPYRGYGRPDQVYIQGRVLKYKPIYGTERNSHWQSFVDSYRRFGTYEIGNAHLTILIGQNTFDVVTDKEGYFRLHTPLSHTLTHDKDFTWKLARIKLRKTPRRSYDLMEEAEIMLPSPRANFGIISDIDDTILQTHVTSLLKLKTLYFTIFKNAAGRRAFREVTAFYQALQLNSTQQPLNPFFYVSNSPWNLYDLLKDFMAINHLPKGPILLRDVGIPRHGRDGLQHGHKYTSIARILETYPEMTFLLIGDSGEKDADIYLDIAREFPNRIRSIYIRDVRSPSRARRIAALIRDVTHVDIRLVHDYRGAALDAGKKGLLDPAQFEHFRQKFVDT